MCLCVCSLIIIFNATVSFRLPYNEFFGGVSGLTVEQFRKINGFPNAFWGWGGEDDDLWNRSVSFSLFHTTVHKLVFTLFTKAIHQSVNIS